MLTWFCKESHISSSNGKEKAKEADNQMRPKQRKWRRKPGRKENKASGRKGEGGGGGGASTNEHRRHRKESKSEGQDRDGKRVQDEGREKQWSTMELKKRKRTDTEIQGQKRQ